MNKLQVLALVCMFGFLCGCRPEQCPPQGCPLPSPQDSDRIPLPNVPQEQGPKAGPPAPGQTVPPPGSQEFVPGYGPSIPRPREFNPEDPGLAPPGGCGPGGCGPGGCQPPSVIPGLRGLRGREASTEDKP